MNNVTNNLQKRQLEANYSNGRKSLLFLVILSVVNLISIPLANIYFLFSAFLPSFLSTIGYNSFNETGDPYYLIIFSMLGLVALIPYAACWYFSKKHYGWMVGALVLFAIETVLVVLVFVIDLIYGEFGSILDLLLHAYVLYCLAQAVKVGKKLKNFKDEEPIVASSAPADEASSEMVRDVTIIRPKKFSGMAARFNVLIDGVAAADIGNNETIKLPLPEKSVILSVALPDNSIITSETIPEGTYNVAYNVIFKTGFVKNDLVIERTTPVN